MSDITAALGRGEIVITRRHDGQAKVLGLDDLKNMTVADIMSNGCSISMLNETLIIVEDTVIGYVWRGSREFPGGRNRITAESKATDLLERAYAFVLQYDASIGWVRTDF